MKRAKIFVNGVQTRELTKEEPEFSELLEIHSKKGTFGKPAHDIFDNEGNFVNHVEAEFTIEITDITEELAAIEIEKAAKKLKRDAALQGIKKFKKSDIVDLASVKEILADIVELLK